MNTYKTVAELKKDWFTIKELFLFLEQNGFPSNIDTIRRWEKANIIPRPKRVSIRRTEWRIYNKDGSDFKEIVNILNRKTRKVISMK